MDIAALGYRIESGSIRTAEQALDRLPAAAGRAERGVQGVQRASMGMAGAAGAATAAITRMATGLVAMAGASLGMRAIVQTLSGFEHSMGQVAAITGATGDELSALRDIAKELGATTEFSASQAAQGLRFLGMAGFSAAESVQAIPDVLNLATAASMDLGSAADIASNIMGAFGIAADKAATVTDVLALASSRANTDVGQLGSAMAMAGPIANSLGVSVGETAAAIGALSDLGIQGSMAGTGLRRVMQSLANATPAATKTLKGMGLTMAELNPQTNSLVDIVDRLAEAGLSAADAFTIFGDRGAPAVLALIENNAKLRELTGALGEADGAAQRMADTMRDTLMGDLRAVISAAEAVIIAFGEAGLTDALRSAAQAAAQFLRAVAENVDLVIRAVTGLSILFAVQYVASVGAAAAATAALSAAMRVLRLAIAGTGIGALALIVTDIIFRIYDATTATEEFGEAIDGVAAPARNVFTFLHDGIQAVGKTFDWIAAGISATMVGAFATIYENYAHLVNFIRAGVRSVGLGHTLTGPDMDPKWATELYLKLRAEASVAGEQAALHWAKAFGARVPELVDVDAMFHGLGETFNSVEEMFASMRGKATTIKPDGLPPAEGKLSSYQKLIQSAHQFIAAQELEARALGMTAEAANRLRYEQDLLNKAANDNIKLTPQMRDELGSLASAMAAAEEQTRQLTETYNLGQSAMRSFVSDITSSLRNGTSAWEAFGSAAVNALNRLADRALGMAADGIWNMLFGALMGGMGGNFIGGTFGAPALQLGFQKGIPGFATGGSFTVGGSGGTDSQLVAFRATPGERVDVRTPGQAANDGPAVVVNVTNHITGSREDAAANARAITDAVRREVPEAIRRYERNPMRRTG